ncbi:undecaprenyl-phosphate alpha-N-acetylglucosaminyl 1-phosphate transferase [Candidatus Marinamargulisbacteria bacterium SCGC AG-439-L15]|nr:undecaprenyl-phosphate alpha-N-acetylglucosaminyl 1-phosphate transferase [Candidatus Marinamargulisbacteria bacterium SCGC AG-439-L15]
MGSLIPFMLPPLIVSFLLSFLLTPYCKRLAVSLKILDVPSERKVHRTPIPLLGGVALYIGFVLTAISHLPMDQTLLTILGGGTLIFILGLVDDVWGVSAIYKLIAQVFIASLTCYFGIVIQFVTNPVQEGFIYLGWGASFLTILWIVGVTNIFNLIDGLDGLSAGVSAISAFFLAFFAMQTGQVMAAILAVILLGLCLGFLRYNFAPAKIFMGDSGAMLLGYLLSIISILGFLKSTIVISLGVPLLIFALPMSDMIFAIIRRLKNKRSIYLPDKEHVHHKLLEKGLSPKQVALRLYTFSFCLGVIALFINSVDLQVVLITGFVVVCVFLVVKRKQQLSFTRFFQFFL